MIDNHVFLWTWGDKLMLMQQDLGSGGDHSSGTGGPGKSKWLTIMRYRGLSGSLNMASVRARAELGHMPHLKLPARTARSCAWPHQNGSAFRPALVCRQSQTLQKPAWMPDASHALFMCRISMAPVACSSAMLAVRARVTERRVGHRQSPAHVLP